MENLSRESGGERDERGSQGGRHGGSDERGDHGYGKHLSLLSHLLKHRSGRRRVLVASSRISNEFAVYPHLYRHCSWSQPVRVKNRDVELMKDA